MGCKKATFEPAGAKTGLLAWGRDGSPVHGGHGEDRVAVFGLGATKGRRCTVLHHMDEVLLAAFTPDGGGVVDGVARFDAAGLVCGDGVAGQRAGDSGQLPADLVAGLARWEPDCFSVGGPSASLAAGQRGFGVVQLEYFAANDGGAATCHLARLSIPGMSSGGRAGHDRRSDGHGRGANGPHGGCPLPW